MHALKNNDFNRLPLCLKVLCWLAVFFSPTIYGLILVRVMPLPPPASAEAFVAVTLIASLAVPPMVLTTIMPPSNRVQQRMMIAGLVTTLGMAVQFCVWVLIIFFPEAGTGILRLLRVA